MQKLLAKSTALTSATLWLWSAFSSMALAQSRCTVNGREIPCDEMWGAAKGWLGFGLGAFALTSIVSLAALIFWILMLVHAIKYQQGDAKVLWFLVILFTGIIGALVYYFVEKRKMDRNPTLPTQPPTPTASG